jgi:hypothetical protein
MLEKLRRMILLGFCVEGASFCNIVMFKMMKQTVSAVTWWNDPLKHNCCCFILRVITNGILYAPLCKQLLGPGHP